MIFDNIDDSQSEEYYYFFCQVNALQSALILPKSSSSDFVDHLTSTYALDAQKEFMDDVDDEFKEKDIQEKFSEVIVSGNETNATLLNLKHFTEYSIEVIFKIFLLYFF